jgi:Na+/H+ antiporter NhaD/arsenite permease-like protein
VGSFSGISYSEFTLALTPVAIFGLAIQMGLLWLLYPEVRSPQPCLLPHLPPVRTYRPVLAKTLIVTSLLLIAFIVGLPLAESAFLAAAVLLVTRRIKPQRVLQHIDWSLLVMFSGLFILTRCVQQLDLLAGVPTWVAHPAGLLVVTAIVSNLISNVPAVLLLEGVIAPEASELATASGRGDFSRKSDIVWSRRQLNYGGSGRRRRLPSIVWATSAIWLATDLNNPGFYLRLGSRGHAIAAGPQPKRDVLNQ